MLQLHSRQCQPRQLQQRNPPAIALRQSVVAHQRFGAPQRCASTSVAQVTQQEPEQEEVMMELPPMEHPVDDANLHNPLQRLERMGTGWFGVLVCYDDGVLVPDSHAQHAQAWVQVAAEYSFPRPLGAVLRRTRGLLDEVVVSRIFAWTQIVAEVQEISERKRAIYQELMGHGGQPAEVPEARPFLELLSRNEIPVALACAQPEARISQALHHADLHQHLDAVVSAQDNGAPELEWHLSHAAERIQRPPLRCVVFGGSNAAVEAAHELGMKCVVVAGDRPLYEFAGADLVVKHLGQVNLLSLKRLFGAEEFVPGTRADEKSRVGGGGRHRVEAQGSYGGYDDDDDDGFDDYDDGFVGQDDWMDAERREPAYFLRR